MICQWSFSFIVFISRVPLTQPAAVYPLHAHLTKSIDAADKKTRKLLSGILATVSQFEVERAVVELRAAVGAHVTVQVLGKLQHRQIQAQGLGQFARGAQVLRVAFPPWRQARTDARSSVHRAGGVWSNPRSRRSALGAQPQGQRHRLLPTAVLRTPHRW